MFIAMFEASRGPDFMTAGSTETHAILLMIKMWKQYEAGGGSFRFDPVVEDINVIELDVGQGCIEYQDGHDIDYFRADDREAAKTKILEAYPTARFFR